MPSFVFRRSLAESKGSFVAEPESVNVVGNRVEPRIAEVFMPELVPRNCRLDAYKKVNVPAVDVEGEIITYCSPDSTFAVTKRLFDSARKSIRIGIYDFSAEYMKELLLNALERGVKITLMLDIDSKSEQKMFDDLNDAGIDGTPAPSCASKRAKYFSSAHEKFIIIDDELCMVQSGNYSVHSIPFNTKDGGDKSNFRPGNRDTGLVLRSRPLARFLTKILKSDIALELEGPEAISEIKAANVFLVERAPTKVPDKLFPSKTFRLTKPLKVQPVLSPDNYMKVVPDKLRAATKSILIEQQYIRGAQEDITTLLDAIKEARDAAGKKFDIRIILGKLFNKDELPKERKNLDLLKKEYGLLLGKNIRYIDTNRFVHCHNKMVLVDGEGVLVSSQNWSHSAVSKNREAGIWLNHTGVCSYFSDMFETDWKTARKTPEDVSPEAVEPEKLREGGYIRVAPADYQEV